MQIAKSLFGYITYAKIRSKILAATTGSHEIADILIDHLVYVPEWLAGALWYRATTCTTDITRKELTEVIVLRFKAESHLYKKKYGFWMKNNEIFGEEEYE